MAGTRYGDGGMGVWPGVVAPLGLTLILTACAWLFLVKVDADRTETEAEALRLESYARTEAGDILAAARGSAAGFVEIRQQARRAQAQNLGLETKGVLDSVYNLLALSLDKGSRKGTPRREIGDFPPGFDGVRRFLELTPPADPDPALSALRANSPEIVSLLPAGCSLAVIEDNARVLYSHGGGVRPAGDIAVALTRDFIFNDGTRNRGWSLRVELSVPDANPEPTAREAAERVGRDLAGRTLHEAAWSGWILAANGEVAASYSPPREHESFSPPFIDRPGQWVDLEGKRRVWLELSSAPIGDFGWTLGVSVATFRPPEPAGVWEAAMTDKRWSLTLAALTILNLAGWLWFVRLLMSPPGSGVDVSAVVAPAPSSRQQPGAPPPQRRLVRDPAKERAIPDVGGVIVADISAGGDIKLANALASAVPPVSAHISPAPPPSAPSPKAAPMPVGSLGRLQAIHRGREGISGSRILDQARSPVLKELAARVRPPLHAAPNPPPGAARRKGEPGAKTNPD